MTTFDQSIYRAYNLDLQKLDPVELLRHFESHGDESRIYGLTSSTSEFLSMRWIRGLGVEIGAGSRPTPLFGNAQTILGDCDSTLAFGGQRVDLAGSIDDPSFSAKNRGRFDFAIASHVLEHTDSFLRAVENLLSITKIGGTVYIVLPDIEGLIDKNWLPYFDFSHHVSEYRSPLIYAELHDQLYVDGCGEGIFSTNEVAVLSPEYQDSVRRGQIPTELRFLHHKHNYSFDGWLDIFHRTREYLGGRFKFLDIRYGHERADCHFVLRVES